MARAIWQQWCIITGNKLKEQGKNNMDKYQSRLEQIVKSAEQLPHYLQMRLIQILQERAIERAQSNSETDFPGSSITFGKIAQARAIETGRTDIVERSREILAEWTEELAQRMNDNQK